jgi:hypothetical protein
MSEDPRPVVDFSKLSWGSLKRYEALYGLKVPREKLRESVKEHFTLNCYNIHKSAKPDVEIYEPAVHFECDVNTFYTDWKTPDEVVENFLKIRTDDKEEPGTRKSTRFREKLEKTNNTNI